MAGKRAVKSIIEVFSGGELDVDRERWFAELKMLDPIRIFSEKLDVHIVEDGHEIPVRIYFPMGGGFPAMGEEKKEWIESYRGDVILFLHGGGWITESVETYERICVLLAKSTERPVLSVEYRRAPENKFPIPLMDGYCAVRALYAGRIFPKVSPENIIMLGDSAGGNMVAAISLLARDRGEFSPYRQILVYPALWNDYTDTAPFASVHEKGTGHFLTARRIEDCLNLYQSCPEDRQSPYLAPLLAKDLRNLPRTLILTAEHDPLRDEGEEFGRRMEAEGNAVEVYRIQGAFHGFFALGLKHIFVLESLERIRMFLGGNV